MSDQHNIEHLKKAAGMRAVDYVQDGMVIGLGTGSTAEFATRQIGARVQQGLRLLAVPTSERTASLARRLRIPLTTLELHSHIDLTIDGADEILLPSLTSIKGLGGALLREKIVALASQTHILIADHTKIVPTLGESSPVPVEVIPFGWQQTCAALHNLGCTPTLRTLPKTQNPPSPYLTDSGNYLIDCKFPLIDNPPALAATIKAITGVVEHGIFIGISSRAVISAPDGLQIIERHPRA